LINKEENHDVPQEENHDALHLDVLIVSGIRTMSGVREVEPNPGRRAWCIRICKTFCEPVVSKGKAPAEKKLC
jgi:hypothetical protein